MVNLEGKRFLDERENTFDKTYAKTGGAIGQQPEATAFQIFDQKTLHLLKPRYTTGTLLTDDTWEGLAKKIGVNVKQGVQRCHQPGNFDPFKLDGVSTDIGKLTIPKSKWALPIDKPPYVSYGVTCGVTFTYAGLKTDIESRVLNNEGLYMSGLWAVGEVSGGYFTHNYPSGSGLVKVAVFGKLAGEAAAKRALIQRQAGGKGTILGNSKL